MIKLHAESRSYTEDPLQSYSFRISIPGLPNAVGFKKIGGLSQEMGVAEYNEGGYKYTHKLSGKSKTGELSCEKGMFTNQLVEDVFRQAMANPENRKTIVVELLDKAGKVGRKWTLAECWCSKWESGELDSDSDDVIVETLTIQYEHFV